MNAHGSYKPWPELLFVIVKNCLRLKSAMALITTRARIIYALSEASWIFRNEPETNMSVLRL